MAKQIKVIKCPQCGGGKPVMIDKDHYRCSKCDTEFILDNDDINVNVNHSYGQYNRTGSSSHSSAKSTVSIVLTVLALVFFITVLGIRFISSQFRKANNRQTVSTVQTVKSDILMSVLLPVGEQSVVFYLEDKNTLIKGNGYSAVFYDIVNGKKIKQFDGLFKNERIEKIEYRKFISDRSCYIIINNTHLYKVEPDTLINMYTEISGRKPALNAGYSNIFFMPEEYGEGFSLETKLGKAFSYFPASDALYTDKALNHVIKGKFETLSGDAVDMVYYLFKNKESKQSKNVSQLMEITYKFNNGGPEFKLLDYGMLQLNTPDDYRIVSQKSITEEFISFLARVLYYDKEYILITYKQTLADDAVRNVQLLDTKGTVLWTIPVEYNNIESEYSFRSGNMTMVQKLYNIRTKQGFMIQNEKNSFLEIGMDGKTIKDFKLPK